MLRIADIERVVPPSDLAFVLHSARAIGLSLTPGWIDAVDGQGKTPLLVACSHVRVTSWRHAWLRGV